MPFAVASAFVFVLEVQIPMCDEHGSQYVDGGAQATSLKTALGWYQLNSRELDIKNSNSWGVLNYPEQSDW